MMRSVERTLAVFDAFTRERPSLTLQEIADRIRLPKSTAFRLVHSLEHAGYLVRLDSHEYCLSMRFTRLAGLVKSTLNIREIGRPVMLQLARQSNETVTLNTVSGRDRVCIDVIDTPSPLMSVAKPGEHQRLITGSTAKVLMAYMPRAELRDVLPFAVKASGKTRVALTKELESIRRNGYSSTHGERVLGLSAMSAPVWDSTDEARYCVTITGPTVRLKLREKEFIRLVVKAGEAMSLRLGAAIVKDEPAAGK
jgi:DNA-binding IclR family transcriptional regulator